MINIGYQIRNFLFSSRERGFRPSRPFRVMVEKEVADHIRSWRFIILVILIFLTCAGSLYTALSSIQKVTEKATADDPFFFLRLFTVSDGTLPPFFVFISFLGPLLGISMGFDAVNSEYNRGTLSRVLAQPIPRDYIINAKFVAALTVIGIMVFALSFLVMGAGLLAIGIPPTVEEFMRIIVFTLFSVIYIAFWLNLSVFFSIRFKQPATSALSGIAIWLFFVVFYPLIVNIITRAFEPSEYAHPRAIFLFEKFKFALVQVMPNELYNEVVSTLLTPTVRSLGPLSMEQLQGAIPGPVPLGQSLMIIWPQVTGLIAITAICFVLSYLSFMRREIRSR
ncbi:MAG: ABC transporter permease [Bacteroidales bacterium]|nr:ABC transporter permease [Bacteroidales bacterium]